MNEMQRNIVAWHKENELAMADFHTYIAMLQSKRVTSFCFSLQGTDNLSSMC